MTIRSACAYKDALKEYKPQQVKVLNGLTLPVLVNPPRRAMYAACTSVDVDRAMALFASALAWAADMALGGGTTREWKRKSI